MASAELLDDLLLLVLASSRHGPYRAAFDLTRASNRLGFAVSARVRMSSMGLGEVSVSGACPGVGCGLMGLLIARVLRLLDEHGLPLALVVAVTHQNHSVLAVEDEIVILRLTRGVIIHNF